MSSVLVPARRFDPEWMDRDDNPRAELEGALHDIGAVNRFLGGTNVLKDAIRPHLQALPEGETLTILDVGTGGADVPLALAAEARRLGRRTTIVGIDRDPVTTAYARRCVADTPEVTIVRADAFALPFSDRSFDIVTASLFLHHFAHDDAVRLVATFRRIARAAVYVNDLERHAVPWAFIFLAAHLTRRHPMFVHDAPLSVLRSFTPDELRRVGTDAGAADARVDARFGFRLLLTVPAGGAP
jgi:SAM-dependent methyltransferase